MLSSKALADIRRLSMRLHSCSSPLPVSLRLDKFSRKRLFPLVPVVSMHTQSGKSRESRDCLTPLRDARTSRSAADKPAPAFATGRDFRLGSLLPPCYSHFCSAMNSHPSRRSEPSLSADPLVVLQPDDEQQSELCRLVVRRTRAYLRRQPLLEEYRRPQNFLEHQDILRPIRDRLLEGLDKRIRSLERQYNDSDSEQPGTTGTINAAWKDWQARNVAFEEMSEKLDPLYLAALKELLDDLERCYASPKNKLYFVAVLVSQSHRDARGTTIDVFSSCQGLRPQCASGWCVLV